MAVNPDDFALVVGIDHYPHLTPLRGAVRDANEFARWLVDPAGGGLDPARCRTVVSAPQPLRPIQDDIDTSLDELLAEAERAVAGRVAAKVAPERCRRFYLFFSGHGLAPSQFVTDLCLAPWSERRRNLALDAEDYLKVIQERGVFREVVAFIDCCRVRKVNARGLRCSLGVPRPADDASVALFKAHATEVFTSAFEGPDGASEQREVRGYFTRALLDGLRGGAAGPGGVPASALKKYLEREVPRLALAGGHVQRPEVQNGMPSDPEPVFGPSVAPASSPRTNVTIAFRAARGTVILEDSAFREVRKAPAAAPWVLTLDPGLYSLTDDASGDSQAFRVRGGTLHVSF